MIEDWDFQKDRLNAFYALYWQPIQAQIGNAKTVYISLDGIYHKIPLATLLPIGDSTQFRYVLSTKEILNRKTEQLPENAFVYLSGAGDPRVFWPAG